MKTFKERERIKLNWLKKTLTEKERNGIIKRIERRSKDNNMKEEVILNSQDLLDDQDWSNHIRGIP